MTYSPITHGGTLSALVIALALTLGVAPQEAEAGACANISGAPNKKCVVKKDIAKNAIVSNRVKDGSLTEKDLAFDPATQAELDAMQAAGGGGGDFIGADDVQVVAVNSLVEAIAVTVPATGVVMVVSGGYALFGDPGSDVRCSITTGTEVDDISILVTGGIEEGSSIATARGFSVSQGTRTFRLVCTLLDGAASIVDATLVAMYMPVRL